jgi:hypothetical protein
VYDLQAVLLVELVLDVLYHEHLGHQRFVIDAMVDLIIDIGGLIGVLGGVVHGIGIGGGEDHIAHGIMGLFIGLEDLPSPLLFFY